ncbi:MAG: T9SS type A sorting domain-containing protein [Saprospiraceae bacterium]
MKKALLFFVLLFTAGFVSAQDCQVDSSLLQTGGLLSPIPYSDQNPQYNLAVACVGSAYNQSVTVNVPATFSGFPIDSVGIAASGAIGNLPAGLQYTCEPPNCIFYPGTLGCILMYGTPSASNPAPDTLDLTITATVYTPLIDIPIGFPGQAAPGNHYYLILNQAGNCSSAATEPAGVISSLKSAPNPFGVQTTIEVVSAEAGQFQFEVFDLLGQRVFFENVRLVEGSNTFTFDAGDLANGSYFYSIGNGQGKMSKMFVVAR